MSSRDEPRSETARDGTGSPQFNGKNALILGCMVAGSLVGAQIFAEKTNQNFGLCFGEILAALVYLKERLFGGR